MILLVSVPSQFSLLHESHLIQLLPDWRTFPFHQPDMLLASGNYLDLEWSTVMGQRINLALIDRVARYLAEIEAVK